jgi:hypothetical protein
LDPRSAPLRPPRRSVAAKFGTGLIDGAIPGCRRDRAGGGASGSARRSGWRGDERTLGPLPVRPPRPRRPGNFLEQRRLGGSMLGPLGAAHGLSLGRS